MQSRNNMKEYTRMKIVKTAGILTLMFAMIVAVGTGCSKKSEDKHDSHAEKAGHSEGDGHDHSKH